MTCGGCSCSTSRIEDAIAGALIRHRDERGQGWADVIDYLTLNPDERRRVVRLLGELLASPPTPGQ
jgi:hypothetical protein